MPTVIPLTVADAFRFATANGAAALGLDRVTGALRVGARADIVLLRTNGLHHTPQTPDPIAAIVLQSRPSDVDTVLIDGVIRKRHGKMLGVDLAALATRAQASSDTIATAAASSAANAAGAKMAEVYAAGVGRMTAAPAVSDR